MNKNEYPNGWDDHRIQTVLAHYENQTEEEATTEDILAWEERGSTFIEVPNTLLPRIRELLVAS